MRHIVPISIILAACIMLAGCPSLEEARAQAQNAAAQVERLESLLASADKALAIARAAADVSGNESAQSAVAAAEQVSARLNEALPVARASAQAAAEALAAAEASASVPWWKTVISIGIALVGAGGGIVQAVRARNWSSVAAHGLQVAQQIKRRAEDGKIDVSHVIASAEQWQRDHGVKDAVDEIRKKTTHVGAT